MMRSICVVVVLCSCVWLVVHAATVAPVTTSNNNKQKHVVVARSVGVSRDVTTLAADLMHKFFSQMIEPSADDEYNNNYELDLNRLIHVGVEQMVVRRPGGGDNKEEGSGDDDAIRSLYDYQQDEQAAVERSHNSTALFTFST